MRWLVRLVGGGDTLDPFCGSGTTLVAAAMEQASCAGIERDPAFADLARARAARAVNDYRFGRPADGAKAAGRDEAQASLF